MHEQKYNEHVVVRAAALSTKSVSLSQLKCWLTIWSYINSYMFYYDILQSKPYFFKPSAKVWRITAAESQIGHSEGVWEVNCDIVVSRHTVICLWLWVQNIFWKRSTIRCNLNIAQWFPNHTRWDATAIADSGRFTGFWVIAEDQDSLPDWLSSMSTNC